MNQNEKKIAEKVINRTSTRESAKSVANWFSTTIEGQQTLSDMIDRDAYLMEVEQKEKQISPIQSEILLSKIHKEIRNKRDLSIVLRVAAVIVPLIFVLGFTLYLNSSVDLFGKSAYTEIYVPRGEDARILFQDGTEAFLNADTRIRYPKKFGLRKREIYLEGEAYFNVAGNSKRPFIVNTGNTNVKVLGTSFNVKSYKSDDEIQVVLDNGQIEFNTPIDSYNIRPGQQIVYNKLNGKHIVKNLSRSANTSLWKENIIYMNDMPLSEVLLLLERKFDVSFTINNPEALKYSYTLTTRQFVVDSVLRELQKISPVIFNNDEGNIEVGLP